MELAAKYSRRELTHLDWRGAIYFVTWRVRDGSADLCSAERDLVQETILRFRDARFVLFAWVVMNDHVHVLFKPYDNFTRSQIIHSWNSYTAHQMQRRFQRVGAVWQAESFDHVIRNEEDLREKWQYILDNPRKRWPELMNYPWVSRIEDAVWPA